MFQGDAKCRVGSITDSKFHVHTAPQVTIPSSLIVVRSDARSSAFHRDRTSCHEHHPSGFTASWAVADKTGDSTPRSLLWDVRKNISRTFQEVHVLSLSARRSMESRALAGRV